MFSIKRNQRKALIIKLGGIGDIVMALPMLGTIDPDISITWVCDHSSASLLQCIPRIQEIITVDHAKILRGTLFEKVKEVLLLWKKLAFKKFTTILLAHVDSRYQWLVPLRKKGQFFSFSPPFKLVPYRYMVFEYLRLAKGDLLPDTSWTFPELVLPSCQIEQHYDVILAPGGNPSQEPGKNLRAWPLKNYVQIARSLVRDKKRVALVGSIFDQYVEKDFPKEVDSYVGKFDLGQLLDFYKKGKILLTHDSGPMHLGILSGIKVMALFGPTIPAEKVPSGVEVIWGGEKLSCRPCYNGKHYAQCTKPLCIQEISPALVLSKIQSFL